MKNNIKEGQEKGGNKTVKKKSVEIITCQVLDT
jgi:hypothetical protein